MKKPSINLQELRRRIYRKAKAEKTQRFWGLYVHVCKMETLSAAYREAKANDGAAGLDGQSFSFIESQGLEKFLSRIQEELLARTYKPSKNRRWSISKVGRLSKAEKTHQRKKWFRQLQRFRCGIEAAISMLKRKFGLGRVLAKGLIAFGTLPRNTKIKFYRLGQEAHSFTNRL